MINILVIDDNPEITSLLMTVLSRDTCRVQTAHDGLCGLQLLRSTPFDLVITDIIMPENDGFDVIMEVNRMDPRPRVIVITGGTERLSRGYLSRLAGYMNVQHVLYKPFSIDELLTAVFGDDARAAMTQNFGEQEE